MEKSFAGNLDRQLPRSSFRGTWEHFTCNIIWDIVLLTYLDSIIPYYTALSIIHMSSPGHPFSKSSPHSISACDSMPLSASDHGARSLDIDPN